MSLHCLHGHTEIREKLIVIVKYDAYYFILLMITLTLCFRKQQIFQLILQMYILNQFFWSNARLSVCPPVCSFASLEIPSLFEFSKTQPYLTWRIISQKKKRLFHGNRESCSLISKQYLKKIVRGFFIPFLDIKAGFFFHICRLQVFNC